MNQSKVRSIENMAEIVIVIVHLAWRELTFVDDVLGGQRTDVKSFCERSLCDEKLVFGFELTVEKNRRNRNDGHSVRCVLTQDI
jgi:hypothetical protein